MEQLHIEVNISKNAFHIICHQHLIATFFNLFQRGGGVVNQQFLRKPALKYLPIPEIDVSKCNQPYKNLAHY